MPWTERDASDLSGKVAIVTGANSGIGLEAARMLAEKGAELVMACRNASKAESAAGIVRTAAPDAKVRVEPLDLSNLASVRSFAERMNRELPRLDLLVNNAGIMAIPRALTADGFEMQLGTNHFGHFALTGLLLGKLLATDSARVVTVASGAHHFGKMDFDDLMGERRYVGFRAYCSSKLCNVAFTFELARRLQGTGVTAHAVHPGLVASNFGQVGGGFLGLMSKLARPFSLSPERGADTVVWLAALPDASAHHGQYLARRRPIRSLRQAYDTDVQRRLWEESERLTGLRAGTAAA